MNFTEFKKCPLNFSLIFSSLILTEQIQIQFFTELQSQKHSTVTSQNQISVIRSQNQQQPIVPIQRRFSVVLNSSTEFY